MKDGAHAHVSLRVRDLSRAIEFYRAFLGCEPAIERADYAKFELVDPPLVVALEPVFHRARDAFDHLGLRLANETRVFAARDRLVGAGLVAASDECERGVECCYSTQTKFRLADPDQNLWEVYAVTGAIEHRGALAASDAVAARYRGRAEHTFEHRLGDPIPERFALSDGAVDEVRLRGTVNAVRDEALFARAFAEAHRILVPGGRVIVHALASGARLVDAFPRLRGPAALVRDTPMVLETVRWLESTGFVDIALLKLGEHANFRHRGVRMRELLAVGSKTAAPDADDDGSVVYKGPFAEVRADDGTMFRRGTPTRIGARARARLKASPLADQFAFLDDGDAKE